MSRLWLHVVAGIALLVMGFSVPVQAQEASSAHWTLLDSVIGGGGGESSSANWSVLGVIGQPVKPGEVAGSTFSVDEGFLNDIDLDGDGVLGPDDLCPEQTAECEDLDDDGCVDVPDGDSDGDGVTIGRCDCNDADGTAWRVPAMARDLLLVHDPVSGVTTLSWLAPLDSGADVVFYDVIRTPFSDDFMGPAQCLESDDVTDTMATETQVPAIGQADFYLVRPQNACGEGTPGLRSDDVERVARTCP